MRKDDEQRPVLIPSTSLIVDTTRRAESTVNGVRCSISLGPTSACITFADVPMTPGSVAPVKELGFVGSASSGANALRDMLAAQTCCIAALVGETK